jgi:hypothetical protein
VLCNVLFQDVGHGLSDGGPVHRLMGGLAEGAKRLLEERFRARQRDLCRWALLDGFVHLLGNPVNQQLDVEGKACGSDALLDCLLHSSVDFGVEHGHHLLGHPLANGCRVRGGDA